MTTIYARTYLEMSQWLRQIRWWWFPGGSAITSRGSGT